MIMQGESEWVSSYRGKGVCYLEDIYTLKLEKISKFKKKKKKKQVSFGNVFLWCFLSVSVSAWGLPLRAMLNTVAKHGPLSIYYFPFFFFKFSERGYNVLKIGLSIDHKTGLVQYKKPFLIELAVESVSRQSNR